MEVRRRVKVSVSFKLKSLLDLKKVFEIPRTPSHHLYIRIRRAASYDMSTFRNRRANFLSFFTQLLPSIRTAGMKHNELL